MTDEAGTEAVALGPVSGAGRGRKPVRHPYRNGSATTHKPGPGINAAWSLPPRAPFLVPGRR